MSKNYDNWERLVAAVLKRELFRQLCHQDSISTVSSDSDSVSTTYSDFSADTSRILGPVSLENIDITDSFKLVRQLGAGEFGPTYVAQLSQHVQQYSGMASRAVIKWANGVDLSKNKFKKQMIVLGNCRHENVRVPRAYYYSKLTKLIVYDYYPQGSLFDMLKPSNGSRLNWESRVKIAVGVALGIAHIHAQSVFHGNIKSSNIFVNRQGYGCVSEFGLAGLMKKKSAGEKGDVYSFGLLLLELVTGQSPLEARLVDRLRFFEPSQGDLIRFHSKTILVDELNMRFPFVDVYIDISVESVLQELKNMLQVAKRCLAQLPEEHPSISEVVSMLDNTRKKVNGRSIFENPVKLTDKMGYQHQDGRGRLVFFEGYNLALDLEDLLGSSAELLGKGTFGTTYKAALEDATTVAVKRLNGVIVGRKDFEREMEVVGNVRHENVAPLRAYYYSKDEKLMFYDFYNQGSVSVLLHGKRGEKKMVPLDLETRLKIGIGVARGVAHIHTQCGGKLIHGNIKSSNIFLNSQRYGCVCDVGLATLMSPFPPPWIRSENWAPVVMKTSKASQTNDVYDYGIFLLELLTGKSQGHLVQWVNSVVLEELNGEELFDVELLRHPNVEEEMVLMFKIAKRCLALLPEDRPSMSEVVKMLDNTRKINSISQNKEKLTNKTGSEYEDGKGRLVFFEGCNAFDLEDLLRSSAKVLGKGTFGTTYKAALVLLEDATAVAVKRVSYKVIIGRKDFEQQMEVVGNIRHENVAPLRAYYSSNDEKLLVCDFYDQGSVSVLLHGPSGTRGEKKMVPLDWEARLRIGIGVARGVAHIHAQCGGKLVHGNIKSSNIFLNSQHYGFVCDVGLATLMSLFPPPWVRAENWATAVLKTSKASQTNDVYNYGIFLLELLMGKSQGHLVQWVNSVVLEELKGEELFDVEVLRNPNVEEEMVSMLQIAKRCLALLPEDRPSMSEVASMLDEFPSQISQLAATTT